ncbi:YutD family protein [Paenibacillus spongiae]|uniref:DUF1027 domain-containing protein n=1 Tax=Paenibacillus spongiae TaxID=2909671 RepID=A0ABY5SBS1_9BACL|nr:YutD-like domain-containing protein [Paenibacillus spongiae]UVI31402.1 DUF1027 domain-containing protein [Paenibacillus spongiae]
MIHIGGRSYELVHDHKNGWNPEAFRDRYSDVLERYDYVIGDWGYNQLRLKGFFRDNHPKATPGSTISGLVDYINEYCNFGCAYFVLLKHPGGRQDGGEDDIDLDAAEFQDSDRPEGENGDGEVAYDAASAPVAAASEGEEAVKREHIRAVPRNHREQRRDYGRSHPNRKDHNRDSDKETASGGRKAHKDRDREHDKDRDKESARPPRQHGGDRPQQGARPKKQQFPSAKAPVAAASETPATAQAPRGGKDSGSHKS